MVTAGMVLMVMSKAGNPAISTIRGSISDAIVPVLGVAASPMNAIADAGTWVAELFQLRADN